MQIPFNAHLEISFYANLEIPFYANLEIPKYMNFVLIFFFKQTIQNVENQLAKLEIDIV